ncbi:hypothetical protein [Streptomyces shenzhenensis]|uniref:hypothetical protein n=1 Tax=Streptomyces shenzhenensis TaxID=943815 RepID=UPI001F4019F2|nr:hypothetical protein [Streptomyces shenzhenensis]
MGDIDKTAGSETLPRISNVRSLCSARSARQASRQGGHGRRSARGDGPYPETSPVRLIDLETIIPDHSVALASRALCNTA